MYLELILSGVIIKVRVLSYIIYNMVFWIVYIIYYIADISLFHRQLENNVIIDCLSMAVFDHLFGKKHKRMLKHQRIFLMTSNRLHYLYVKLLSKAYFFPVEKANLNNKKIIFIGFHVLGIWERLLAIMEEYRINAIGIIGADIAKNQLISSICRGTKFSIVNDNEFIIEGKKYIFCPIEEGIQTYGRAIDLLKKDIPIFILYDELYIFEPRKILNEDNTIKDKSKFFIYKYKDRELLIISSFIFYMLQKTGVIGVPVYVQRLWNGKDIINLGEQIKIQNISEIRENGQKICNQLGDFLIENILSNSYGWIGLRAVVKYIAVLWQQKEERSNVSIQLSKQQYKIKTKFLIRKYKNEYILVTYYPLNVVKISKNIKKLILLIKKYNSIPLKLFQTAQIETIEELIRKLYMLGLIEIKEPA